MDNFAITDYIGAQDGVLGFLVLFFFKESKKKQHFRENS